MFGTLKNQSENVRLQLMVVAVGVLLLLAKFVAFFLTNSNAILTDALESIINVVAGGAKDIDIIMWLDSYHVRFFYLQLRQAA